MIAEADADNDGKVNFEGEGRFVFNIQFLYTYTLVSYRYTCIIMFLKHTLTDLLQNSAWNNYISATLSKIIWKYMYINIIWSFKQTKQLN